MTSLPPCLRSNDLFAPLPGAIPPLRSNDLFAPLPGAIRTIIPSRQPHLVIVTFVGTPKVV